MQVKLQQALALHQRGRLSEAQALYEEILRAQPAHPDALHLGALVAQSADPDKALELFARSLALDSTNAVALYNRGKTLQDLKRWEEALASYDRAIAIRPDYAEAWCNRGVALRILRRPQAALASCDRAIAIKPDLVAAHFARGITLHELNRPESALSSCDQAIALEPADADLHAYRGIVLMAMNRWEAALASLDRALALNPHLAEAHSNRGLALATLGRREAAIDSYDRAVAIQPELAEAYSNRGLVLAELGKWEAALASHDRAIALRPLYAKAHANRGTVLQERRQWEAALASYDRAIAIQPDYAEAYLNRGVVLAELERWQAALASYARAIELDPDYAEAYYNRGNLLKDVGQWQAALANYDHALVINPRYAEAHSNRGTVLCELNRVPEALACYDVALAIDPDLPEAHFNRSVPRLLAGEYESGWRDYEWRWKLEDSWLESDKHDFTQPLWQGEESLAGKTILLHAEQGLGDVIQFCRYATLVAELGARVILEVPHTLAGLLKSLRGVAQVVVRGQPLPAFDYYCPVLSLPFALRTTLASVPARIPYLRCDAERARYWQGRLGARTKPRVGLVWSGIVRLDKPKLWSLNKRRNIPLKKLAVLKRPDIEFYSLQKGQPAESELEALLTSGWDGPEIINYTSELRDFADTAALIEQLDLVISVDTSTAHVAGALGKSVWLMNRFDTCWRWMLERTDSPWYPTLRLYRQERPGDWDGVVNRVGRDLDAWSSRAANSQANLKRAVALHQGGELREAQALYEEILSVHPRHFGALHLAGVIAAQRKDLQRALELIDLALEARPDDAMAHYNKGTTLQGMRRWEAALASFNRSIEINPGYADAYLNRGIVQRELGQSESSLASYDRAIDIKPDFAEGYCNRGNVQRDLGQLEAAVASYDRAIAIRADFAEGYCNRANVLRDLGRIEAALADYDRALTLNPEFARAHVNRSLAWLSIGEFEKGWRDYEWRWKDESGWILHRKKNTLKPLWLGAEPLASKTILVHSEQGFGDTIQFCRYTRLVADLGARVILEVPAVLCDLLATLPGVSRVIAHGDPLPSFDYYCPLLSLPLAFKTTLESVPAHNPPLSSSAERLRLWEERLGPREKMRVGLVWAGASHAEREERSSVSGRDIPLAKLAPLRHSGIEFYSLQKGECAESELRELVDRRWDGPELEDFTSALHDFADTAALMQQLDLIITVDTSTAHLAGALGLPVWVLNRYSGCWRWLTDRTDSPWYPTLRLYRQERPGDWDGVVEKVRADLEKLLHPHPSDPVTSSLNN